MFILRKKIKRNDYDDLLIHLIEAVIVMLIFYLKQKVMELMLLKHDIYMVLLRGDYYNDKNC